jgi:NodT family efflux transporter outer membrane factor (OMF) lipoprotein
MRNRIVPLILVTWLTGCMVGPNYQKPAAIVPPAYKETQGWTMATPADGIPKGAWWTLYNDPDLDRLEPLVAVSNQTVAADYAAYEEAQEIVAETRGGLFPTIGLTGSATRQSAGGGGANTVSETNTSGGSTGGFSGNSGPRTSGTFEGSVDWTPDIWGKIRREVEGDIAAAEVSQADLANATLSAQATLAADYVDLRAADANISLLRQTVAAYQRSLQITENQYNAGIAAQSDVITARTQLEGTQAQLINEGAVRAQYEHAIAVLAGHAPIDLNLPPGALLTTIPEIPPGLPSTLLQRRPDIAAAERTMAEENAQIGVAVAAFYPDISLSALGGYAADPIGGLFSASNELWSLGASGSETLFEGGTRTATVKAAAFGYDENVANYRQTVLTAFQDVEDDLSNLRILAQQAVVEQAAVSDAARAVQIALNEYQAGTEAYTTVVTAQATLLSDQETALTVQQDRLVDSISLIQDLGGGWQAPGS